MKVYGNSDEGLATIVRIMMQFFRLASLLMFVQGFGMK